MPVGRTSDFLAHYESEFYDPQKAHEYYLRNRELKGRRAAKDLKTDKKKQAWEYTKDAIGEAKRTDLDAAATSFKAAMEQIRSKATERRKQLSEKLSQLLKAATETRQHDAEVISNRHKAASEKISKDLRNKLEQLSKDIKKEQERLSEKHARESERISKEASDKIAALPPIPKGISAERRSELAAKRSEEIAKIRGTATKEHETLSKNTKTARGAIAVKAKTARDSLSKEAEGQREALSKDTSAKRENLAKWSTADKTKNRERVNSEREAVSSELKATVERGRAYYKTLKDNLKAKYETALDTEFEAIKRNV